MPTDKKRINLTVDDSMLRDLILFQRYLHHKYFWRSCSLSFVVCYIVKEYLRNNEEWRKI